MLRNYSKSSGSHKSDPEIKRKYNWWMLFIIPAWVTVCFFAAQMIMAGLVLLLHTFNVQFESVYKTALNSSLTALVYIITLLLTIVVPWKIKKLHTSRSDIGWTRLPQWVDIMLTPAGLIVYLICSSILILIATSVFPWFDVNQIQDVGFGRPNQQYELFLIFTTLVVVAPVAEEIIFRGYLYGKLKKYVPIWAAILATSVLFGAIHGAWNLAVDTFSLSVVLCLLREYTGSLWASILLHMLKNSIAFFILFIYPILSTTIVG